ncbi:MAG: YqbH/XkdH family protein [Bacteroidales bacterium]|nr:YqbH/XkdH family protein [Bacteroidales bacterium]
MSLEALLDHHCDIYHIRMEQVTPGYGLPESPIFHYADEPDEAGVTCHFGVKSASMSVNQDAPANMFDERTKLTLPLGTDIRINDKIIDCDTGLVYTAEHPVNIRQHHLFVYIHRIERQREL